MLKQDINLVELKVRLLTEGGVENWCDYGDALLDYVLWNLLHVDSVYDNDEYNWDEADICTVLLALEEGGVERWEGYSKALAYFNDYQAYLNRYGDEDKVVDYNTFVAGLENKKGIIASE